MSNSSLLMTALFVLGLVGAYSVYQPFLLSMGVATLLTMATFNFTQKMMRVTRSTTAASAISTLLLSVLLFAPIIYLATVGVHYLGHIDMVGIQASILTLKESLKDIHFLDEWSKQYLTEEKISEVFANLTQYLTAVSTKGLGFMKNMVLVVVFYFFINYYGNRFFDNILKFLPVSPAKGENMFQEISGTMEVVFYSIIITAIFEGLLFGILMSFFGFNGLFFGVVYGFASLIPVVGGFIVWAPVSLYVWTKMDGQTALFIATYSIVVISIIADTFIKPFIIKVVQDNFLENSVRINSLLIFFSILAGMSTYGFWGMILGPAITTFLIAITTLFIEHKEQV
jgi:predicted PurR-regulated permease PerM